MLIFYSITNVFIIKILFKIDLHSLTDSDRKRRLEFFKPMNHMYCSVYVTPFVCQGIVKHFSVYSPERTSQTLTSWKGKYN